MPALYSHTTRATGLNLTADIYNTDHQNHITNGDAAGLGGHSTTTTQMQSTVDPGEVGSENLVADLAGEIECLRFILKEIKATAQWYTTTGTRVETLAWSMRDATTGDATDPTGWNDATLTSLNAFFRVPEAYNSGDLTFTIARRGAASNTAVMDYSLNRIRSATAISLFVNAAINFTPGNTNTIMTSVTAAAAQFIVGDIILITISRYGSDGSDTMTQRVACDGLTVSYTAFAGRP